MKSVLISIQPQWCELIIDGKVPSRNKKTVEVRKTKPNIKTPFKCYIYCTQVKNKNDEYWIVEPDFMYYANGSVIGEFVCDKIYDIRTYQKTNQSREAYCEDLDDDELERVTFLKTADIANYLNEKNGYGWHISDLKIYDKPEEISEFFTAKICRDYYGGYSGCDDVCGAAENNDCRRGHTRLTCPPQSWCYVEELKCNT